MVRHGQQRVRVRRQVDPDDLGLLVHHVVDEAGVLVAEAVVVLPPDQRGEQVVQRGDRAPPGDAAGDLQPLGVLVEHRVDDVDERLVAVEQAVPPGQQVALEPPLAHVLGQHLHHPAPLGHVVVPRHDHALELLARSPRRRRSSRLDSVSSGPNSRKFCRVVPDHVAQPGAEHPGGLRGRRAGRGDVHGVVAEVGQPQVAQEQAAVGVRVRAHPPVAARGQRGQFGDQRAVGVEQLLGVVRAQPLLQLGQVLRVLPGSRRSGPGAPARCPPPAGRPPPWARSSPWGCAARSPARRACVRSPSTRARCWMARISAMTASMVAASCWCTSLGSSPSTMYGV